MKLFIYPYKKERCLLLSSKHLINTDYFKGFQLQLSSKNSVFFRLLSKKPFTYFMSSISIEVPNSSSDFLGIKKGSDIVLLEIVRENAVGVWKKKANEDWQREDYLGSQLIVDYSKVEFDKKIDLIKFILEDHFSKLQSDFEANYHGDFTHFNILVNQNGNYFTIDQKQGINSLIFDHFYFYAYLKMSVSRNSSISKQEKKYIIDQLGAIISSIINKLDKNKLEEEIKKTDLSALAGLSNPQKYFNEFLELLSNE